MNFATLTNLVINFTENTESSFLASIPNFVQLCEEDIYRNVDFPVQTVIATTTCTPGVKELTLPADLLNFDYMYVLDLSGNISMLLNKEVDYIFQVFGTAGYQDIPEVYAMQDNNMAYLGPTPDQAYTIKFQYENKPESIVTAGVTWVGDNAENALLYGTLVHAYTYMKGEDSLIQMYKGMYQQAIVVAKTLGETNDRKDSYRTPDPRNLTPDQGV